MIYLLDSNVWISLIRGTSSVLAAKYQAMAPAKDIRVCSVVVAELWYGCARSAKPVANRHALQALIAPYPSLPFDDAAADLFATIRQHTHNTGEFSRVPRLTLEDWLLP